MLSLFFKNIIEQIHLEFDLKMMEKQGGYLFMEGCVCT